MSSDHGDNAGDVSAVIDKNFPVDTWLKSLTLPHYIENFKAYKRLEDVLHLTENDLKELGIKNNAHRTRIMSALKFVKEKSDGGSADKQPLHGQMEAPVQQFGSNISRKTGSYPVRHSVTSSQESSATASYEALTPAGPSEGRAPPLISTSGPQKLQTAIEQLWYFGAISRELAEESLRADGEFLVRESISKPGEHVLSCQWSGRKLHFVINRERVRIGSVEKVVFLFEDDSFASVEDLIRFHLETKRPISETSGAIIIKPANRIIFESKLMTYPKTTPKPEIKTLETNPDLKTTPSPSAIKTFLQRDSGTGTKPSSKSANSSALRRRVPPPLSAGTLTRTASDPSLSPVTKTSGDGKLTVPMDTGDAMAVPNISGSVGNLCGPAPPKPSRIPTIKAGKSDFRPVVAIRNKSLYDDDGRDYTDYDQVKAPPVQKGRGIGAALSAPGYIWRLLKDDNKPLDATALAKTKELFLGSEVNALARHMTLLDLNALKILPSRDLGYGIQSGLELVTLPQGAQLRADVLERYNCLKMFVSVTVLTSFKMAERLSVLKHWISLADELRRSLGNQFGFAAITNALHTPQMSRLVSTWKALEDNFPSVSHIYNRSLAEYNRQIHQPHESPLDIKTAMEEDITIPNILPIVELMEESDSDGDLGFLGNDPASFIKVLLSHLNWARWVTGRCHDYRRSAEGKMRNFKPDQDLLEMFGTEMHVRFLWGARGSGVERKERYQKFQAVLSALSKRVEPD